MQFTVLNDYTIWVRSAIRGGLHLGIIKGGDTITAINIEDGWVQHNTIGEIGWSPLKDGSLTLMELIPDTAPPATPVTVPTPTTTTQDPYTEYTEHILTPIETDTQKEQLYAQYLTELSSKYSAEKGRSATVYLFACPTASTLSTDI
jgi:hypothetical protein